jgi:two-component system, NarL family, response regulator LiaR
MVDAMTIRVVLVDDHRVVTRGLRAFMESFADVEVAGIADSGEDLLGRLAEWRPDVVVLDLLMPGGLDGIATMRRLKAAQPEVRVVALTASTDASRMQAVLRAGALGYVRKDADPELLLAAVRAVSRGRRFIAHSTDLPPWSADLSRRELDVLRALAAGLSNREIAARLAVSPETIKSHVANLLSKLELPNRTALVAQAFRLGLTEID